MPQSHLFPRGCMGQICGPKRLTVPQQATILSTYGRNSEKKHYKAMLNHSSMVIGPVPPMQELYKDLVESFMSLKICVLRVTKVTHHPILSSFFVTTLLYCRPAGMKLHYSPFQ